MSRGIHVRSALATTVPTLLTLPVCCALAAVGQVPWAVVPAVLVALAVLAVVRVWRAAGRGGRGGLRRGGLRRRRRTPGAPQT
ncbi:hypothetical protein [Streptomyces cinnamoneus]|uniref:hypothetical protein n=1 Tax=Streptomyces cinnamoneus TaxID=53446 RepID=UPI0037A8106B